MLTLFVHCFLFSFAHGYAREEEFRNTPLASFSGGDDVTGGDMRLANAQTVATSCSRAKSRIAHSVLYTHFWPYANAVFRTQNASTAAVPASCPLHAYANVFRRHENAKHKLNIHNWKCDICGKAFSSEAYLDAHLERRHMHQLLHEHSEDDDVPTPTCLADHCDVLHCQCARTADGARRHDIVSGGGTAISAVRGDRKRVLWQPSHHHHHHHADDDDDDGKADAVHNFFMAQFCAPHACTDASRKPPPKPFSLPVPRPLTAAARVRRFLFGSLSVIVVVGLAYYYYVMLGHVAATSVGRGDLKRVRDARRPKSRLNELMWLAKTKLFFPKRHKVY
ncbi:C2H2-type domain-containing protein [Pycnococcus provasolii]